MPMSSAGHGFVVAITTETVPCRIVRADTTSVPVRGCHEVLDGVAHASC